MSKCKREKSEEINLVTIFPLNGRLGLAMHSSNFPPAEDKVHFNKDNRCGVTH